ncbi:MAG TPA: endolytic transglycosylase MltG, partial [Gemmatimonadaceae bacterium]|nr:endolytic transglycosylase MltG [Gemmatimonadaceae bacterium]
SFASRWFRAVAGARGLRLLVLGGALATLAACGGGEGPTARVTIPKGSSFRAATDSLAAKGIVNSPLLFRVYAKLRGRDRTIQAGTYVLHRNARFGEVLAALNEGKSLVPMLTIPEGWTLERIVPQLAKVLELPADSVVAAVRDTAWLHRLDIPTKDLEGYLFPDTYTFTPGTPARAAVATMVQRFEEVWRPEWTARLDSIAMSRHDVMTLASIVEREARRPEERPVIAAVYMNRLRSGMALQADPTVQYALGGHRARLLYKDLEVDSPYNTYRHAGLPPGPIGAPGAPSIRAALWPAQVPYRFFVAFPDGHHEFRRTFAEHQVAVAAARRARDSVNALRPVPAAPGAPAKR